MNKILNLYKISIKGQLLYKKDFYIQTVVWILYAIFPLLAINILLLKVNDSNPEYMLISNLMFGIISISYNLARMFGRGLDNYSQLIFSGDLDVYFTRPIPIIVQVLTSSVFLRRIAGILVGFIAIVNFQFLFNGSINIVALFVLIVSMLSMYLGFMMISAAVMMLTVKGTIIAELLVDSSANCGYYPLDSMGAPAKQVFKFIIPIFLCLYVPAKKMINEEPLLVSCLISFMISSLILCLGIFCFNKMIKKYQSSNG